MPSPSPVRPARRRLGHPATAGLAAALLLSACGGGGSSDAPRELSLSGVVAVGAAVEGAAVSIQCAGEGGGAKVSASATSLRNGSFNKALPAAKLPCVLRASKGDLVLHSVAEAGDGLSATANITPLTELISAQLAGAEARTLFDNFDAATQAKLSHDAVLKAIAAVGAIVKDAGVDLANLDPIRSPLTAAHVDDKGVAQKGNDLDLKLDALGTALKAAGTTVPELAAVIAAYPADPEVAKRLLQPATSRCAGLRSGRFRVLNMNGETVDEAASVATLDALALKFTDARGQTTSLATTDQVCQLVARGSDRAVYVDASGLAMAHGEADGVSLLLPEQNVALADLAGQWNVIAFQGEGSLSSYHGTMALDDTGKVTAETECAPGSVHYCDESRFSTPVVFQPDPAGGFIARGPLADLQLTRLFAFKAPDGTVSMVAVQADAQGRTRGFLAATRQSALALPARGSVSRHWILAMNQNAEATRSEAEYQVSNVDTAAQAFIRVRKSDGQAQVFAINKPRPGLRYREGSDTEADATLMSLPGTGLAFSTGSRNTARGGAASDYFSLSIRKP